MKIRHGVSSCYYCTESGTPTAMPGAVKLELNGNVSTFSAETLNLPSEIAYIENIGYIGKLTLAALPEAFCTDIFGYAMQNGILVEKHTDGAPIPFQLLWQTKGTGGRYVLYKCFAVKPDILDETDTKEIKISTVTIQIYAYPDADGNIKANTTALTSKAVYDSWFSVRH